MITKRVVLVLGAGASIPFGFPSGPDLKKAIVDRLDPNDGRYTLRTLIQDAGFHPDNIEGFRSALRFSGKRSVDAFLEHRPDFLEVGKAAIAGVLLPCENEAVLFDTAPNWYEYFFNRLNATFDDFGHNCVSVVTFNYDRSLEQYLLTALQKSYCKTPEESAKKLQTLEIIHFYGQLGELPPFGAAENQVEYRTGLTSDRLKKAAQGIHIVHEQIRDEGPFQRAYKLIHAAERICFLGFGYDPINVERLLQCGPKNPAEVLGSALGFSPREIENIIGSLNRFGFVNCKQPDATYGQVDQFLHIHCPFD